MNMAYDACVCVCVRACVHVCVCVCVCVQGVWGVYVISSVGRPRSIISWL